MPEVKSQFQNIYGDAEGLLKKEVKLEIIDVDTKQVKLKFTPSQKCQALEDDYTVKAYFRYRLREEVVDIGVYSNFRDTGESDTIDLSTLGDSWKDARWQLKISGVPAGAKERFIFAWTDALFIEPHEGQITFNGESIFSIKKDDLDENISWEVAEIQGLPTLVVARPLHQLFEEIKSKNMISSIMIVEAVKSVMDLICKYHVNGTDVTDPGLWQGKWVAFIENEFNDIEHPFSTIPGDIDADYLETYIEFRNQIGKEFMKKTEQFAIILNYYEQLEIEATQED